MGINITHCHFTGNDYSQMLYIYCKVTITLYPFAENDVIWEK